MSDRGYKKTLGDFGEYVAEDYLSAKGYHIIDRNFLAHGGEIDLIATYQNRLVFIEVKTRKSNAFGTPAYAVDYKKRQHMLTAAKAYLAIAPTQMEIQFDVMEVLARQMEDGFYLDHFNHIENIVMEGSF